MRSGLWRACTYTLVFVSVATTCQFASAQWRTHYLKRDGLFHVEKYHTGNGLTQVGGDVLMTGITAFAPIVGSLVGREAPRDEASRDMPRDLFPADYIVEQQRATDLLNRTANLVNWLPPAGGTSNPQGTQGSGQTGSSTTIQSETGTPAGSEFGPNPWRGRPSGAVPPTPPAPGNGKLTPSSGKKS